MTTHRIATGNLGFPRIGSHRELKFALERFWSGEWTSHQLETAAREIRHARWKMQAEAAIDHIPSNDFSLYDHVLDTAAMVGAVPSRYGCGGDKVDLAAYFAMARGSEAAPAMEMTKWFDTNYHYIVPEFEPNMEFHVASHKPAEEFLEAKGLGLITRPVLLGPVSFVLLGKIRCARSSRAAVADALVEVYRDVLNELKAAGAPWVQIDEPCLGLDLSPADRALFSRIYDRLATSASSPRVLIATYFSDLRENLELALRLPVAGLHLDLVRGDNQLPVALDEASPGLLLSLGVIDGRNIWRSDLERARYTIRKAADRIGLDRLQIAPSCSLMHIPVDLDGEGQLEPELRSWLAFAKQKLNELTLLARAAVEDAPETTEQLADNRRILAERRRTAGSQARGLRRRVAEVTPHMLERSSEFAIRRRK